MSPTLSLVVTPTPFIPALWVGYAHEDSPLVAASHLGKKSSQKKKRSKRRKKRKKSVASIKRNVKR